MLIIKAIGYIAFFDRADIVSKRLTELSAADWTGISMSIALSG